jgi:hypothetical protein
MRNAMLLLSYKEKESALSCSVLLVVILLLRVNGGCAFGICSSNQGLERL